MQVKCDNPVCGRLFNKKPSHIKLSKRHFCSNNCKAEIINRTVLDPLGEFSVAQEVRFVRKLRQNCEEDFGLVNGFSRDGKRVYVVRNCNRRGQPYPREWLSPEERRGSGIGGNENYSRE